jgi:hypothetical protein
MLGGGMQMKVPGSASQDMHPSSCVLRVVYSETYGESRWSIGTNTRQQDWETQAVPEHTDFPHEFFAKFYF